MTKSPLEDFVADLEVEFKKTRVDFNQRIAQLYKKYEKILGTRAQNRFNNDYKHLHHLKLSVTEASNEHLADVFRKNLDDWEDDEAEQK